MTNIQTPTLPFTITRIHTAHGIFRLSGHCAAAAKAEQLNIMELDFLGTDGWVAINLTTVAGLQIVSNITPEVVKHLR